MDRPAVSYILDKSADVTFARKARVRKLLVERPTPPPPVDIAAAFIEGATVFVEWPFLRPARIVRVAVYGAGQVGLRKFRDEFDKATARGFSSTCDA